MRHCFILFSSIFLSFWGNGGEQDYTLPQMKQEAIQPWRATGKLITTNLSAYFTVEQFTTVVHLINWLQNLAHEITALLQNTNFRNEMSFWQGLFSFLHFYMTIAFSSSHYEALFHSLLLHFPFLLGKWRGTGLYIATDEIGAIQPWRATGKLITTNLSV